MDDCRMRNLPSAFRRIQRRLNPRQTEDIGRREDNARDVSCLCRLWPDLYCPSALESWVQSRVSLVPQPSRFAKALPESAVEKKKKSQTLPDEAKRKETGVSYNETTVGVQIPGQRVI
jgi:hypothetical protein